MFADSKYNKASTTPTPELIARGTELYQLAMVILRTACPPHRGDGICPNPIRDELIASALPTPDR
jgi:hypothetical protein